MVVNQLFFPSSSSFVFMLQLIYRRIMSEISLQAPLYRRARDAPVQFQSRKIHGKSRLLLIHLALHYVIASVITVLSWLNKCSKKPQLQKNKHPILQPLSCLFVSIKGMSKDRMIEIRRQNCNPMTMKVTYYKKPVFIHQGYMQWLWDVDGRRYLDLFAGVATVSVGHCHP